MDEGEGRGEGVNARTKWRDAQDRADSWTGKMEHRQLARRKDRTERDRGD